MKRLLLCLLMFSNLVHCMEKEDFEDVLDLNNFENLISKKLTEATLDSFEYCGAAIQLTLVNPKKNEMFLAQFIGIYPTKDGIMYLIPLFKSSKDAIHNLKASAWDYQLIRMTNSGHTKLACETLQKGSNPCTPDKRLQRPIFNLLTGQKTLCTREDFENTNITKLVLSNRPIIAVRPYSNTYNFTAIDHAVRQCNIGILELIRKTCENDLPDEVLEKMQRFNVERLRKKLNEEQATLQSAQSHLAIPTFPIMPRSGIINPNYVIESEEDPELKIYTYIDKDTCIIETQSDPAAWKTRYLDIDSLATLYARLITMNETEGTKILDLFDTWSKYNFFTTHVIRYVLDNLENETYDDQPLLPENILRFAQRIAHYKNDIQKTVNPLQSECLVGTTLCLCAAKAYNPSGELINPQWQKTTDTFIKDLVSHDDTKQLCIQLCNDNKPLFFVPIIKTAMKKTLLQRYCVRILSNIKPHLGNNAIEHIVSYWEPGESFLYVSLLTVKPTTLFMDHCLLI